MSHFTKLVRFGLSTEPPNPGMEIDEEEVKLKRNWLPKNKKYNIAFDLVKILHQYEKVNFGIKVAFHNASEISFVYWIVIFLKNPGDFNFVPIQYFSSSSSSTGSTCNSISPAKPSRPPLVTSEVVPKYITNV